MTGDASAFIQWKGSDVCLDFSCSCGYGGHVDGAFLYAVRCSNCRRVWMLPHTFQLIEDVDGNATKDWTTIENVEMSGHVAGGDHAPYGSRKVHPTGEIGELSEEEP